MSDPYRTQGRNGNAWFVDSDGDILRLDRVEAVYATAGRKDEYYAVTVAFVDGSHMYLTKADAALLKKELLEL